MNRLIVAAAVAAAFVVSPLAAQAPPPPPPAYGVGIGFDAAKKALAAAEAEAKKNNWPVAIAIVDSSAKLVAFSKMDDTQHASVDIAIGKAVTANNLKRPTKALQDGIAQGGVNLRILGQPGRDAARRRRADRGRRQDHRRHRRLGRDEQPGRRGRHGGRRGRRNSGRWPSAALPCRTRPRRYSPPDPASGRDDRSSVWRCSARPSTSSVSRTIGC